VMILCVPINFSRKRTAPEDASERARVFNNRTDLVPRRVDRAGVALPSPRFASRVSLPRVLPRRPPPWPPRRSRS
jgi:hypothetical protein